MSSPSYTLEVISHHPQFKNKSLRKYYVEGIETVGAWGDEPFEIRFKNHTWQKVQVKISLDGTDILTGDRANTATSGKMWVVNGYGTLDLKAWPETNNGGASFIFTSANNSVAVNTHGDLSSRGIIAAAVYVEGHVEPIRVEHHHHYPYRRRSIYDYDYYTLGGISFNSADATKGGTLGGGTTSTSSSFNLSDAGSNSAGDFSAGPASASVDSIYYQGDSRGLEKTKSSELKSLVSVGAGQHVDQKIKYVQGLIKPTFTETVRVRYLWWDDLVAKLKEHNIPAAHASGFPGDNEKLMSIGGTPRIGSFQRAFPREEQLSYLRV